MALPQGYYPAVLPPDPEWLGQAFLTQFLVPALVKTRYPSIANNAIDLESGFVRIEAGDTHRVPSLYGAAWDTTFLMHSYADQQHEVQASETSGRAMACVAAATGLSVVGWYIVDVISVIGGRRLSDPEVPANLVRYRSAVTWRVAGQPLTT